MAGIALTNEIALGAALLTQAGATVDVWLYVPGRTRFCQFAGCDETGATTTLRYRRGEETRYADVATGRILTDARTAGQCLKAYDAQMRRNGETSGQRMGRLAGESLAVRNARLFLTHLETSRPRRDLSGRFAGHHVEPAGRF